MNYGKCKKNLILLLTIGKSSDTMCVILHLVHLIRKKEVVKLCLILTYKAEYLFMNRFIRK